MKRIAPRVVSLAAVFMVLFNALFALPVHAEDYVLQDTLGLYPSWVWDNIYTNMQTIAYGNMRSTDEYVMLPESATTSSKSYYTGDGGSLTGLLGSSYTTTTVYNQGDTYNTSFINQTYNTTTNNYNYEYYDITNNEYYNIVNNNIQYNSTYNTYYFETTNNYNYYINYSPTYVNITYMDGATGNLNNQTYFYKLPDGRNSWDLTADEVFGMYFIYDCVNYDMVIEDAATLALYHFDNDLKDESAYSGTPHTARVHPITTMIMGHLVLRCIGIAVNIS